MVGRIDPKADRKNKVLVANSLSFEPAFQPDETFLSGLCETLLNMARFNGCEAVKLEKTIPQKIRPRIERLMKTL